MHANIITLLIVFATLSLTVVQASQSPRSPRSPRAQKHSPQSKRQKAVTDDNLPPRGSSPALIVVKTPPRSPANPKLKRKASRPNSLALDEKDTRDSIISDRRPSEKDLAQLIKKKSSKFELSQLPEDTQ